jgi:hypothetical protein
MTNTPQTIPFNIIDRSYLISETEQENSAYFPMSIVTVVKLRSSITQGRIVVVLHALVKQYPNLRLGYRLDVANRRWVKVSSEHLTDHLSACVREISQMKSMDDTISEVVASNNMSLTQPLNVFIAEDYLMLRMHHSFGDGKFLFLITQYLLAELQQKPVNRLPLSDQWRMPLWQVIWQSVGQGTQVMWQFVKSLFSYYQDYQQDTSDAGRNTERVPITTGRPMSVCFKTIASDGLVLLKEMQQGFSLNTLLQVLIEERLHQLGLITRPTTFTIPVDLRRYLRDPNLHHPGNLASQVRLTIDTETSIVQRCETLQTQLQQQLQNKMPLASIPGEWLLALGGNKLYQSVNRDWLLKSTYNDPRFFVLTNLGNVDTVFDPVGDLLSDCFEPQLVVPLMGGPPLVFSFNEHGNQGNLAVTFDPQILSRLQVETILEAFEMPFLVNLAKSM